MAAVAEKRPESMFGGVSRFHMMYIRRKSDLKELAVTKPSIRVVSTSRKILKEASKNGSLFWNASKTTLLSMTILKSKSLLGWPPILWER